MVTAIIAAGGNLTINYNAGQVCDVVKRSVVSKLLGTKSETCLQQCFRPLSLYGDQALILRLPRDRSCFTGTQ